jgi:hypothetical protein
VANIIHPIATKLTDEEVELQETVDPIIIVIPLYLWVSSAFFANFVRMHQPPGTQVLTVVGVYLPQAMRLLTRLALDQPGWKRMVVVEGDMIMPQDALIRHALHTDPLVGSLYFQHRAPHEANVMIEHPDPAKGLDHCSHMKPEGVKHMLEHPGLYRVSVVGMGCTSIRRDVLEDWDHNKYGPMWRNDFEERTADDVWTGGEISHDVRFCKLVREQGHNVWIDSSMVCEQLTEGVVGGRHYLAAHAQELGIVPADPAKASSIILPNRAQRRHPAKAR